VCEIGQRRPAPEAECVAEESRREFGRRLLRLREQPLEAEQVELVRPYSDQIARLLRDDDFAWRKRLAQLGDVVLERILRGLGRLRTPELVDQSVGRDDLVRAGEQQGEDCPLPRSTERKRTALVEDCDRSEDPKLHDSSRRGS
jgi:hypothetical protein